MTLHKRSRRKMSAGRKSSKDAALGHRVDLHKSSFGPILVQRGPRAKAYGQPAPTLAGDVGFNLICTKCTVIHPGFDRPPIEIPVDMRVKLPSGTFAMIISRSSTFNRYPGLFLCTAPIDNGYTGPIGPRFKNLGQRAVTIPAGESLVQLVVFGSVVPGIKEVEVLPETIRGVKRFGSTGK